MWINNKDIAGVSIAPKDEDKAVKKRADKARVKAAARDKADQ